MISAYAIIPVVFGIVLTYLWLIHRLWLRNVVSDEPTLDFAFARDLTQHVTLQGIDRLSQLLSYLRQHPVVPPRPTASNAAVPSSP